MILTDREIKLALQRQLLVIDPQPGPNAYSSTAVDLTLDEHMSCVKEAADGLEQAFDPGASNFQPEAIIASLSEQITIPADGWLFKPGHLVLAWTKEYVKLESHNRIAARVEGKSSLARLGLGVHVTAPTIHAGFDGQIRLEMMNHGRLPIRLRSGMRICQLIFEQTLGTPDKGYKGQFSGQTV